MVPFYDPRVFERVNLAILDLFDRIEICRYNADGSIRKKIRVPITIHFSKVFADFVLNTQVHKESKHTTPILGLRMGNIGRNEEGTTSRVFVREIYDQNTKQIIQDMRPSPWKMTYTLTSYTESIYDHFQIMQLIVPYFNPTFNTAIKEFEFSNLKRDIIVELKGVAPQWNDELDREKARSYVCEYTFDVKFDMYAPFYIGTLIKQINNSIASQGLNIETIKNVEVKDMTIDEYNRKMNEVVDIGKQLNSIVVSSIDGKPNNIYRKFVDVNDASPVALLELPANAGVYYGEIAVVSPFNDASASVSIGTLANPELLMGRNESNLLLNSKFSVEISEIKLPSAETFYVFYTRGSATDGSLEATIKWN